MKLRPYQQQAVERTLVHFRQTDDAAVLVLPTGSGKSLVIAELARLAKQKILVLTHVKELVAQNHSKYQALGLSAGVFSAGLGQKNVAHQVTFASVQSLARNRDAITEHYSLLIIDECHRVSGDDTSQYQQIITKLKEHNPQLKVLGLTATPYRLGTGWIYHRHYQGFVRGEPDAFFKSCIFELPIRTLISQGYLTPPKWVDAGRAHYDFSALMLGQSVRFSDPDINQLLKGQGRATAAICEHIINTSEAENRQAVMIFAATVNHAKEIMTYLPDEQSALVVGETDSHARDQLISQFKAKAIRYLVNVSVLTTGFDAPHVDFIAVLRPTESVSLYQQIVGRGLRLAPNKTDCLVVDYAGNQFDLYHPEVGSAKPNPDSEPVQILCPGCGFANVFWGKTDADGKVIEHFGRRCQGLLEDESHSVQCDYRFRFKECPACGEENDIAARRCHGCDHALVDPDDKLRDALNLKHMLVIRCQAKTMALEGKVLHMHYFDEDGLELKERFDLSRPKVCALVSRIFLPRLGEPKMTIKGPEDVEKWQDHFKTPDFVIAKKEKYGVKVIERLFDYDGAYRKANALN